MQKELIRLECLKLAHRADRGHAEIVSIAKELEKYVLEHEVEILPVTDSPALKKPGRPKKNDGNSDILS